MNHGIILSENRLHGYFLPTLLARKLEKNDIPVLVTQLCWPRDELFIAQDGTYTHVQKDTCQGNFQDHFAWHGGTYLQGPDFILVSKTANADLERSIHGYAGFVIRKEKTFQELLDETVKQVKVTSAYAFDITRQLSALSDIRVGKKAEFYNPDFAHIDVIYNICNTTKHICTYNHQLLLEQAQEIASTVGYQVLPIPLEEAAFAAVGFVEHDNNIIIDCRAKKTAQILQKRGYNIITTPFSLANTNQASGSLRCITRELPFPITEFSLKNPKLFKDNSTRWNLEGSLLGNRSGEKAECDPEVSWRFVRRCAN